MLKNLKITTGRMLIFYEIMKNLSGDLTGQHSWLLSKIFLEITHQENIIAYGNTLTNPAFANGIDGKESFDFIIANPPFGVDWKHNYDDVLENMQNETRR